MGSSSSSPSLEIPLKDGSKGIFTWETTPWYAKYSWDEYSTRLFICQESLKKSRLYSALQEVDGYESLKVLEEWKWYSTQSSPYVTIHRQESLLTWKNNRFIDCGTIAHDITIDPEVLFSIARDDDTLHVVCYWQEDHPEPIIEALKKKGRNYVLWKGKELELHTLNTSPRALENMNRYLEYVKKV